MILPFTMKDSLGVDWKADMIISLKSIGNKQIRWRTTFSIFSLRACLVSNRDKGIKAPIKNPL